MAIKNKVSSENNCHTMLTKVDENYLKYKKIAFTILLSKIIRSFSKTINLHSVKWRVVLLQCQSCYF